VTEEMLTNMFIGDPPGNTDRILDFSTAVTGSLFFAPSADFLDDLPDPPGSSAADPGSVEDSSLGIGSLKRSTT
jgi:porphyrinogen peroxidase